MPATLPTAQTLTCPPSGKAARASRVGAITPKALASTVKACSRVMGFSGFSLPLLPSKMPMATARAISSWYQAFSGTSL